MRTCWVVTGVDVGARHLESATQLARLRGLAVRRGGAGELEDLRPAPELMVLDAAAWQALKPGTSRYLWQLLDKGAVVYVRGGFVSERRYSLQPLAGACFKAGAIRRAVGFRLTDHSLLPAAIENLGQACDFDTCAAEQVDASLQPLAYAKDESGGWRPAILARPIGAGWLLFDLQPDDTDDLERPILSRLQAPGRHRMVGALAAVDRAAGRDPKLRTSFNVIIDDRPANLDFRLNATERWLSHNRSIWAAVHTDFAWTPDQRRPRRRYIEMLKGFGAGFVWHGFHHHVDHRRIGNLAMELSRGRRLVAELSRRYQVRFQPIMVFPYERANPEAIRQLKLGRFLASVEYPEARPEFETPLPSFLRYSTPLQALYCGYFPILRRYPPSVLDEPRLLALAMLGLPIIAAGHPKDLALRRFRRINDPGSMFFFDRVLDFAAAQRLRPMSLEEIALEVIPESNEAAPAPGVNETPQPALQIPASLAMGSAE